MNARSLLRKLASFYPKRLSESYDHPGLQVGPLPKEARKIFLCLDFDITLKKEVLSFGPDLIITHHPFFFGKKEMILEENAEKRESYAFLKDRGIALLSYHTSFDRAKEGMNDALAERLGLKNVKPLELDDMARGGELPRPLSMGELAQTVTERLDLPYAGVIAAGKGQVSKIALIGGGGWRSWKAAKEEGYDAFLSGDCPHFARREIILDHYNYIDMPHEVESIFIEQMTKTLLKIDQNLILFGLRHERPWTIVQRASK